MNKTDKNHIFKLAEIVSPFGIKGFVFAKLFNPDFFSLIGTSGFKTSCVVSTSPSLKKNSKVTRLQKHKNGIIVQIEGCDTRTTSEGFVGKLVFSNYHLKNSFYLLETIGFMAYDSCKKLGSIKSVYHNNAHGVLVLSNIEIPFVDRFIEKIDWKNKKIEMKMPKGLYEI